MSQQSDGAISDLERVDEPDEFGGRDVDAGGGSAGDAGQSGAELFDEQDRRHDGHAARVPRDGRRLWTADAHGRRRAAVAGRGRDRARVDR